MSIDDRPACLRVAPFETGARCSAADLWSRQSALVRDLIAELVQIQDAVRRAPIFVRCVGAL